MKRQFTASVYILHHEKVLLVFHKKMKKWMPPGGHLDPSELPPEAAIREALEETGVEIELISEEHVWVEETWNSKSFQRPFMCLVENISATPKEEAHQHIDFIYIGRPKNLGCESSSIDLGNTQVLYNKQEVEDARWFSLSEIESLEVHEELFYDTFKATRHILLHFPTISSSVEHTPAPSDLTCASK